MAIFGRLEDIEKQVDLDKFSTAINYLKKAIAENTEVNKRLLSLPLKAFEKVSLDDKNFALEQVYKSKDRDECFFESHKKYIDVQFILEGEEIIEVDYIKNLKENLKYNETMDLIKYEDSSFSSSIKLKKGDVAVFFPEDAHMPCIKIKDNQKVVKTVVKVEV